MSLPRFRGQVSYFPVKNGTGKSFRRWSAAGRCVTDRAILDLASWMRLCDSLYLYHDQEGMERWVGLGVIAGNLLVLGATVVRATRVVSLFLAALEEKRRCGRRTGRPRILNTCVTLTKPISSPESN